MQKTIQEAHNDLDSFYETPFAGLLLIHKGPAGQLEIFKKETRKLHELSEETQASVVKFFDEMNATTAEFICTAGKPDRVRISVQL
jgi:hypothetical protein